MWPFKNNPPEKKPEESPIEDKCAFMEQIVLDHSSGGNVIITIQSKNAKHVEHVSKKIKDTFSISKIDPISFLPTLEQIEHEMKQLDGFREVFNAFRDGKK